MSIGTRDMPFEYSGGADSVDLLGLAKYAKALARFVRTCDTPMTVGIQGEWGSGKTSLINMVDHQLRRHAAEQQASPSRREAYASTFRFEAWRHGAVSSDSLLGFVLLRHLVGAITAAAKDGTADKIRNLAGTLGSLIGRVVRSAAVSATNQASLGLLDGGTLMGGTEGGTVDSAQSAFDELREKFEALAATVATANKEVKPGAGTKDLGRCIVFIDDLDRVHPEQAVSLLEVVKNFADVNHCVFVVACDYEVVRLGVKAKFGITDEEKVRAFFDKIIQVPFRMPVESYQITDLLQVFLKSKVPGLRIGDELPELIAAATGTNPRAFKRFLNMADLLWCLEEDGDDAPTGKKNLWADPEERLSVLALAALQTRWPKVAQLLSSKARSRTAEADQNFADLLLALKNLGSTDAETLELPEDLEALLQSAYGPTVGRDQAGSPTASRRKAVPLEELCQHREVAGLGNFGGKLFALLDKNKDDALSPNETKVLGRWAKKLDVAGSDRSELQPTHWDTFKASAASLPGGHGQKVIMVAAELHSAYRGNSRFIVTRLEDVCRVQLVTPDGRATLITVNTSGELKINATPDFARRWSVIGNLVESGDRLREGLAAHGLAGRKTDQSWICGIQALGISDPPAILNLVKEFLDGLEFARPHGHSAVEFATLDMGPFAGDDPTAPERSPNESV